MEDVPLHEVEDDIHSSGHPAGHAVAGEYVHMQCTTKPLSCVCDKYHCSYATNLLSSLCIQALFI